MSSSIPLTNAVTSGDEKAVSVLLADGADVNESTNGGQTALILAVIFGHTNLVRLLMKAGADPQVRDNLGLNAIEWAQRRGLTEALDVLTGKTESSTPPRRTVIAMEEPPAVDQPQPAKKTEARETVSDAEKSRRWLAGVKQRLDEQNLRRLNRNEAQETGRSVEDDLPPLMSFTAREVPVTGLEKAVEPEPVQPEPVQAQPEPQPPEPINTEPQRNTPAPRILTPPPAARSKSGRKRCPQCNAIYNSDLVAYCAHHIVPLVDADDPIISESPKANPPLFWILLIVTLSGSIVAGTLITTYVYKTRTVATRSAAVPLQTVQKGTPEAGTELAGKALSLLEAECPVKGPELLSGTVTVRVMVDKNGQVYWARGMGGDWLMRGCATEAAMKSTFSAEKLRGREIEGTITYTFKP